MELTIQQLSNEVGVTVHTLRYYEREGLISSVNRAKNGHRRYTEEDIVWIRFLRCLRNTGMPISRIKEYINLMKIGPTTVPQRQALLEAHRVALKQKLTELTDNLEMVNLKIEYYENLTFEPKITQPQNDTIP